MISLYIIINDINQDFLSPVELIDVLDVPKQRADLLRTDRQITLIDDVSQVILQEEGEEEGEEVGGEG